MTKQHYKQICNDYEVNPRALKEILKKDSFKIKDIKLLEVLQQIYIHAPDLIYCRQMGYGGVEYLNIDTPLKLIKAMNMESNRVIINERA